MPRDFASLARSIASIERGTLSGSWWAWMSITPVRVWADSTGIRKNRTQAGKPVLLSLCFFAWRDDFKPKNVGSKAEVAGRRPAPRWRLQVVDAFAACRAVLLMHEVIDLFHYPDIILRLAVVRQKAVDLLLDI